MKKGLFFSIIFIGICIFLNNCKKAPVYPDTPQIEYNKAERFQAGDSIVVTLNFKDGDGDLGLESTDINPPYHELDFDKDQFGNYKTPNSPSAPPYNCKDYVIDDFDSNTGKDTVLLKYNPYYNNYIIDLYVKQPNQSYDPYDFTPFPMCGSNFNGRFPLLNPLANKGPIEGTLAYTVKDLLNLGLLGKTVKFRIYIYDRSFNKSNIIETPDISIN